MTRVLALRVAIVLLVLCSVAGALALPADRQISGIALEESELLHSAIVALFLADCARDNLLRGLDGSAPLTYHARHAARETRRWLRQAEESLDKHRRRTAGTALRSLHDPLLREVRSLAETADRTLTVGEEDAQDVGMLLRRFREGADPGFGRLRDTAVSISARLLDQGGRLARNHDEMVWLMASLLVWHGEKIAGLRKTSFEGLLAQCPEVRYEFYETADEGRRCRYYDGSSGAAIGATGNCRQIAKQTDSPLADGASQILDQLRQRLSATRAP